MPANFAPQGVVGHNRRPARVSRRDRPVGLRCAQRSFPFPTV